MSSQNKSGDNQPAGNPPVGNENPTTAGKRKPDDATDSGPTCKRVHGNAANASSEASGSNAGQSNENTMTVQGLVRCKIKYEKLMKRMTSIFTPSQLKRLQEDSSNAWSTEDFVLPLSINNENEECYEHIQSSLGILFPNISEINNWVTKFDLEKGIQNDLMCFIKHDLRSYSAAEKLTVLIVRDIPLSPQMEMDDRHEKLYGHGRCQFVIARGLKGRWSQLVYYKYDQLMIREVLMELLNQLYRIGLPVVAITFEVDSDWSRALLTALIIGPERSFPNPADTTYNIHIFYDAQHLLVKARNHFVCHGWNYEGKTLNKYPLIKIMNEVGSSNYLNMRLHHREVGPNEIKPATELFSTMTAKALEMSAMGGILLNENWLELKFMVEVFCEWFKIFNTEYDNHPTQIRAINKMKHFLMNMSAPLHDTAAANTLNQIREGILTTNTSLFNLLTKWKERFPYTFKNIQVDRLNRDGQSKLFSLSAGSVPTALTFKRRLMDYVFPRDAAWIAEDDRDERLAVVLNEAIGDKIQAEVDDPPLFSVLVDDAVLPMPNKINSDLHASDLKYIAGYVASKFINKYPALGDATTQLEPEQNSSEWIHMLCEENAIEACEYLNILASVTEEKFRALQSENNSWTEQRSIVTTLANNVHGEINNMMFGQEYGHEDVTRFMVKTRIYIKLRINNQQIMRNQT